MADEEAALPEDGADAGEADGGDAGGGKKGPGILPKLLKLIAIGLGALVFIVTIVVITFNIMNGGGKQAQATIPQTDSYQAIKPIYATYDGVGQVMTRTHDPVPWNVSVSPVLQYDMNDTATQTELIGRKVQLIDFFRRYFSQKNHSDLEPENEAKIKSEIQELLNTTILDKARVRGILFTTFDLFEMSE